MASPEPENPAVEPEAEERGPERYRVTAPTAVLGHEPKEEFEELLDPIQEARLLESGALRKLGPKSGRKAANKKKE